MDLIVFKESSYYLIKTKVPLNGPAFRLNVDLEDLVAIEEVHATRNEGKVVAAP